MDYVKELEKYAPAHTEAQVAKEVAKIKMAANRNGNVDVYKFCYSAIDLTTLSCTDSQESVQAFVRKAVDFYEKYPNIRKTSVYDQEYAASIGMTALKLALQLFVQINDSILLQQTKYLPTFSFHIAYGISRIDIQHRQRIAIEFMKVYRHPHQHLDTRSKCLPRFLLKVRFQHLVNIAPNGRPHCLDCYQLS